jgi:hypothetical protein
VRLLAILTLGFFCAAASAAVTCGQLAAIGVTTQQLRDQGYSLAVVLGEVDKLEASDKFTVAEMRRLRATAEQAFNGARSPREVTQECMEKEKR